RARPRAPASRREQRGVQLVRQRRRQRSSWSTQHGRPGSLRVRRSPSPFSLSRRARRTGVIGSLTLATFLALPLTPALAANPPVVTGPSSPGNSRAPVWTFTADAGATTDCRTVSGATVIED